MDKLKEVAKKVWDWIKAHPKLCGGFAVGVLAMIFMFSVCGCDAKTRDTLDIEAMSVVGFYEVTEGTQQIISNDDSDVTRDITGATVAVSQNGVAIASLDCLGKMDSSGKVSCSGTDFLDITAYGPVHNRAEGTIKFQEDGTVEFKTQLNGEYLLYDVSWTITFNFKAKLLTEYVPSG